MVLAPWGVPIPQKPAFGCRLRMRPCYQLPDLKLQHPLQPWPPLPSKVIAIGLLGSGSKAAETTVKRVLTGSKLTQRGPFAFSASSPGCLLRAPLLSPSHSFFPLLCVPPQFESQAASSLEGVIISQGCGLSLPLAVWGHLERSEGKSSSSWHNLCASELLRPRAVMAAAAAAAATQGETALAADADVGG